jgi:hypothetical protein
MGVLLNLPGKDQILKKLFLLCVSVLSFLLSSAQDSCALRISLLTCTPGSELYSTFGHTALRVQDPAAGTDLVFNYGTFEFTEDFYAKFIRGKLRYSLSVERFDDFIYNYQLESRSVVQQQLLLSCTEKEKLYDALQINSLEQNRYYRYDFLFDNCTTRARDIVTDNTATPVSFKNILPEEIPTFRDLIHSYLDAGKQYWSKLGIDLLLGAKLDRKVTNLQSMFLPDYLLKGFDSAFVNGRPLATPAESVLQMPSPLADTAIFTPFVVFSLLLLLVLVASLENSKWTKKIVIVFDFLFFFALGLAGIVLLFMWFGTDHTVCQNNYNLLWALPTHVLVAFFLHTNKAWVRRYSKIVLVLSCLLALTWFLLPQQMNIALFPVLLLIMFRSWQLSKNK